MDEDRTNQSEDEQTTPPESPNISLWAILSRAFGILSLIVIGLTLSAVSVDIAVIFSLCSVLSLSLSFIFGIVAMVHIGRSRGTMAGMGIALTWTIISALVMLLMSILFPIFARARRAAQKTNCLNNIKSMGTWINMYQTDWDDKYPLVSGPGRAFEEAMGQTWNYRTNSTGGERRWMQNVLSPYVRYRKILWCPSLDEERTTWTMAGQHPGVVHYWRNRHGGFTYRKNNIITNSPDIHGKNNPNGLEVLATPKGSTIAGLQWESDPPTSYWFNVATVDNSGMNRGRIVISGQSSRVCDKSADAPIIWDTPCGYAAKGTGEAQFAHDNIVNVLYADGHAKPYAIPNSKTAEWTMNDFGNTHGYEGWFPE